MHISYIIYFALIHLLLLCFCRSSSAQSMEECMGAIKINKIPTNDLPLPTAKFGFRPATHILFFSTSLRNHFTIQCLHSLLSPPPVKNALTLLSSQLPHSILFGLIYLTLFFYFMIYRGSKIIFIDFQIASILMRNLT